MSWIITTPSTNGNDNDFIGIEEFISNESAINVNEEILWHCRNQLSIDNKQQTPIDTVNFVWFVQ